LNSAQKAGVPLGNGILAGWVSVELSEQDHTAAAVATIAIATIPAVLF